MLNLAAKVKVSFNEKALERPLRNAARGILKSYGAIVRKISRDFIKHKRNPNQSSAPLHSPYDHFGLRASIQFAADEHDVVIGPRYIRRGLQNVARIHEFGGNLTVKKVERPELLDKTEIGDVAPVTSAYVSKKDAIVKRDGIDRRTGYPIIWTKIRTKSQREESKRLYKRMVRDSHETVVAHYPPRPYMRPALMKALPTLPRVWKNAIKN